MGGTGYADHVLSDEPFHPAPGEPGGPDGLPPEAHCGLRRRSGPRPGRTPAAPPAAGPDLRLLPKPGLRLPRRRTARRQRRLRRAAVVLDLCASAAMIALTAGALAAFLAL